MKKRSDQTFDEKKPEVFKPQVEFFSQCVLILSERSYAYQDRIFQLS